MTGPTAMTDRQAPACVIVIFGASGDLAYRKLVPALHSLDCQDLLADMVQVLGVGRSEFTDETFRERLRQGVEEHGRLKPKVWSDFAERLTYLQGSYDDPGTYRRLEERLEAFDRDAGTEGNRLYHMALPPNVYPMVIRQLGRAGLQRSEEGWVRIIVEKPFGHDLESGRQLNKQLHRCFGEEQVYRIDHYLGKETVQNILTLRFANAIFEPLWNRNYVDHVQITVAESIGIENRAAYYEQAGVLRDMFQNHLMQLLTLTAMEPPVAYEADTLRNEKYKVLRAVQWAGRSVRGQYEGYRDHEDVAKDSATETYAALELLVNNWRWRDVPFYLRSGKRLRAKATEIAIQFRHVPHLLFPAEARDGITPNTLFLCIQPDEGVHLRFETKEPGASMMTQPVEMEFHYARDFGPGALLDAYERLLLDAMLGDPSLFARADEVEEAWKVIDPILENWHQPDGPPLTFYAPGAWGPAAADRFMADVGRTWWYGCSQSHG
jgi:glucose-6-phosphate 1-dehydrogenase